MNQFAISYITKEYPRLRFIIRRHPGSLFQFTKPTSLILILAVCGLNIAMNRLLVNPVFSSTENLVDPLTRGGLDLTSIVRKEFRRSLRPWRDLPKLLYSRIHYNLEGFLAADNSASYKKHSIPTVTWKATLQTTSAPTYAPSFSLATMPVLSPAGVPRTLPAFMLLEV
ncbi:hypothetical protein VTP01DRAFT_757 [Rhizomucor pusillus]|uniref:uncharacterized protein n=1 Tax=Rhizomucor pusillus TaxID=4840 RepID=UPI0037445B50